MTATQMVQTIDSFFKHTWKRHRVTLGLMCWAAFGCRRLNISEIGRHLEANSLPKHAIKRVDRWLGTRHFNDRRAREDFARLIIGSRKQVLISVDWTKLRAWPVLVAGLVYRGRAVPLLWSVADPKKLYKSQNAFEHGFLGWLSAVLPANVKAVVLMDRGFKRVELVRVLRRFGFSFVIRTGGNVHVRSSQYNGRIDEWIRQRGQKRRIDAAILRPSRPVTVNVVGLWRKGSKEPWLLMTDLSDSVTRIAAMYAKRFRIEETFRDQKDWRFGLQLGYVLIRKAQRVERWLLVAAVVLFLALLVGGQARCRGLDRGFRANRVRHRPTHSDFTLGLFYARRRRFNRSSLLADFHSGRLES
jgi:hypothetical protein